MSQDLVDIFDITNRLITPAGERPKWKDAEVWSFVKTGLRRTMSILRTRNVGYLTTQVDVTVGAGDSTVPADTLGSYGFITKPLRLWEKPASDTNGWTGMQFMSPLVLNVEAGDRFRYWDYQRYNQSEARIFFPAACTQNMTVKIEGPVRLFIDNSTTNQLFYPDILIDPGAFFAASLAAQAAGNMALAQTLERQAMEFVDGIIQEEVHKNQRQPARMYAQRFGLRDRWY